MGRRTPLIQLPSNTEVNLTSLMDLTFILLMYFIITFPMADNGIPVNLPKTTAHQSIDRENSVNVTINDQGLLFVNNSPTTLDALATQLTAIRDSRPNALFLIRADGQLQYEKLAHVLSTMNSAKITRVALVTKVAPREDK